MKNANRPDDGPGGSIPPKSLFGFWGEKFALRCAHSLCGSAAQLAHLRSELYFSPRTRRAEK